jgi:hypothetical protein
MGGKFFPKTRYDVTDLVGPLTLGRLAVLIGLGAVLILLERTFRWPLQLPGHHGLEAMALLTMGRLSCTSRWSATIVGASAATTASLAGVDHGVLMPLFYVVPGIAIDLGYAASPRARRWVVYLPLLAALAFATKPLMRWGAQLGFGLEFGSLRHGLMLPVLTHLVFGFVGALIAVMLWRAAGVMPRRKSESDAGT